MEIVDIVKLYNEDGLGLKEIAEKINSSKSTVQRKLKNDGWQYNRKENKYEKNVSRETTNIETNVSRETIDNGDNVINTTTNNENNVSRETIEVVNRTYGIPSDLDRALKIKCAIEGKKAVDIVREALKNAVEQKYFDYK